MSWSMLWQSKQEQVGTANHCSYQVIDTQACMVTRLHQQGRLAREPSWLSDAQMPGPRSKQRASISKDEVRQLRLARICFNLREAFLQDSTWHFFDPLYRGVFASLCLYRIEAFVQWLTGTFRPELVKLQTEADVVSKYMCGFFPGSISLLARSLDALCIDRASIASEYRRFL
ncbi:hypothetical protein ABBQ32_010398 [Trebouxia sp. C0010 RCD-2024]